MVFVLDKQIIFPDPKESEEDGLLAIGGDLRPERLIKAYSSGIFPWFSAEYPYLWWSPDPRLILLPGKFKLSKSLKQKIRKADFSVRYNYNFPEVIRQCSEVIRPDQEGTWITEDMKKAYIRLHELGYAHSVEIWIDGELAGGLYGVAFGRVFFGESMFHNVRDASKLATWFLVQRCLELGIHFIDSQVTTGHLLSLGAEEIPRDEYLKLLKKALKEGIQPLLWA